MGKAAKPGQPITLMTHRGMRQPCQRDRPAQQRGGIAPAAPLICAPFGRAVGAPSAPTARLSDCRGPRFRAGPRAVRPAGRDLGMGVMNGSSRRVSVLALALAMAAGAAGAIAVGAAYA